MDQAVLQALVEERFPRINAALETSGAPLAAVSASWQVLIQPGTTIV